MKICLISKYPPIEGGVSSKNYWLAKELGKRGHDVFVVTNAWEVEDDYREKITGDDLDKYQPRNVNLFNTDPSHNPFHIPNSKMYTEKIASLAIDVIEKYDVDLIDSKYMIPYVISGWVSSKITGKPQILRHAGSDITRLLNSPYLNTLFKKIFNDVDKILTYPSLKKKFRDMGVSDNEIILQPKFSVDTKEFTPKKSGSLEEYGIPDSEEVLTFLGKPQKSKGIYKLIEAVKRIDKKFKLLLVIGKNGRETKKVLKKIKEMGIEDKVKIIDFLPPWKIPYILASSTAVVCPEYGFNIPVHLSLIPKEAMACGTCPVISTEILKKYPDKFLKEGEDVVSVDPGNIDEFSKKMRDIIENPETAEDIGKSARKKMEEISDFDSYVSGMIKIYRNVADI